MDKYVKQHWNGELPLWKSYWINFVILPFVCTLVAAFCVGLVIGMVLTTLGIPMPPENSWDIIGSFVAIPFIVWAVVGTWRSADKYKKALDGMLNWGTLAQVGLSFGVTRFVLEFINYLK